MGKYDQLTMSECRHLSRQKCKQLDNAVNPFAPDETWKDKDAIIKDIALLNDRLRDAIKEELGDPNGRRS